MDDPFFPHGVRITLPPLGGQSGLGEQAVAHVKFFSLDSDRRWYATEFDGERRVFFGLVIAAKVQLEYFSLDYLQCRKFGVERDSYWIACTIAEVRSLHP